MTRFLTGTGFCLAALLSASPSLAGNVAKCEVVALLTVEDESGGSASYRYYFPASDFLRGVYDPDVEITREQDGHPIEGITCARDDLMPDEEDFAILATGIPMVLSQDFDRPDTDVLTLFFADGKFQYRYLSDNEMAETFRETLDTRLADFSTRDHGLGLPVVDTVKAAEADEALEDETDPVEVNSEPVMAEDIDKPIVEVDVTMDTTADPSRRVGTIIVPDAETPDAPVDAAEPVSDVADLVFDPESGTLVEMEPKD